MILLLLGTDAYRKRERRVAAIAKFGVALDEIVRIDDDSTTIQALDDALLGLGLFATKKVVLIPEVGELPKAVASRLVELLPSVDPPSHSSGGASDTLLILEADKLDQRTELAKALKKLPTETFEPFQAGALVRWVADHARALGVTIEPTAATGLIQAVGSSTWRLHSELEKLAVGALGIDSPRITVELVRELTSTQSLSTLFALTDALIAHNRRRARITLAQLMASGEAPLGILGMLGYHLRTLAVVKDAMETGVPAKLHPFVVQKHAPAARALPWDTLERWYAALTTYDWEVKTGKMDADVALELMVHELSEPAR